MAKNTNSTNFSTRPGGYEGRFERRKLMNRNQLVADQIDAMEGLADLAERMVENTDINLFSDLFGGLSADDLNHLAAELEEIE